MMHSATKKICCGRVLTHCVYSLLRMTVKSLEIVNGFDVAIASTYMMAMMRVLRLTGALLTIITIVQIPNCTKETMTSVNGICRQASRRKIASHTSSGELLRKNV
mmetsp:Transcript_57395/g.100876  ORF Transcript_57395/g.100876 Transcript_57395/m.100876 type:complete len:105 (-) Transcript_57395:129-443(-)